MSARRLPGAECGTAETWRPLSLQGPVPLEEGGDLLLVRRVVELGEEIVRAEFVEIAPPPTSPVVPDAIAARHASGHIPSPTHAFTVAGAAHGRPAGFRPPPRLTRHLSEVGSRCDGQTARCGRGSRVLPASVLLHGNADTNEIDLGEVNKTNRTPRRGALRISRVPWRSARIGWTVIDREGLGEGGGQRGRCRGEQEHGHRAPDVTGRRPARRCVAHRGVLRVQRPGRG